MSLPRQVVAAPGRRWHTRPVQYPQDDAPGIQARRLRWADAPEANQTPPLNEECEHRLYTERDLAPLEVHS